MVTSLIFLNEMPYINTYIFLSLLNLKTTIKRICAKKIFYKIFLKAKFNFIKLISIICHYKLVLIYIINESDLI